MNTKEILNFCIKKGVLIDDSALDLFEDSEDVETVKLIIEKVRNYAQKQIITKEVFYENKEQFGEFLSGFPKENKSVEKLKIKLGLSIEILRQKSKTKGGSLVMVQNNQEEARKKFDIDANASSVKIVSSYAPTNKKIEVKDFVNHFRNRFKEMRNSLQEHSEINNLVSINKISGNKQGVSVIGMVYDRKITKNKNIILEIELTGRIKILINQNKQDLYKEAENIALDTVIGAKGSGNKEIIFANKLFLPETFLFERKKSPIDESVLFISDIHVGSKLFMEKNFLKFIDYLNGKTQNTSESDKIKYLFIVGDIVAGVGCYPNQERDLGIVDLEEQYLKAAELFGKIRKNIQIIILPGNHDCVRLMEPQPILDEKYAWPLYDLKNVTLVTNPSVINIGAKENFPGFNVLAYHGFSYFYYAHNIPGLIADKANESPDKVMAYLLKNKHLAPTHASVQYYPSENNHLMIKDAQFQELYFYF